MISSSLSQPVIFTQIPPWPGDPKIPDFPVANQQIISVLRNASEELTELREEKDVTNSTFQVKRNNKAQVTLKETNSGVFIFASILGGTEGSVGWC